MSDKEITTVAIADFVKAHGTITAPAVGKHFGQPYWTGEIEKAAKPLIESGQITISSEQGVVWVESPEPKRIEAQTSDSNTPKGNSNEAVLGQCEGNFASADAENEQIEPLERFSFFDKGLKSANAASTGTVEQFINQVRTNAGWKYRIGKVRAIEDEEKRRDKKAYLPAVTTSIEITRADGRRKGIRDGEFVHTNLIQADFDNHPDPNALLKQLKQDKHVRACFASPSEKAKAFIKVFPVTTNREHDSAWIALQDYCRAQGYGEIDTIPKAVNALCFISHDPNAILKNAIPLDWELLPEHSNQPARPKATATDNEKPTPEQMQQMLSFIDADDYEIWLTVGCALKREGYDFDLWDKWSRKSVKYDLSPDQMLKKWDSFNAERERKATLGTIYHYAKDGGWQPPRRRENRYTSPALRMARIQTRRERYGYDRF